MEKYVSITRTNSEINFILSLILIFGYWYEYDALAEGRVGSLFFSSII